MQEVFEKIIEKMEVAGKTELIVHGGRCNGKTLALGYTKGISDAIKIVKQEAEQYNNGWIPCSVYLPKEKDGRVLICCEDGNVMTGTHSEFDNDNEWYKGDMYGVGGSNVIAWQPLPQPYQQKGEMNG